MHQLDVFTSRNDSVEVIRYELAVRSIITSGVKGLYKRQTVSFNNYVVTTVVDGQLQAFIAGDRLTDLGRMA